MADTVRAVAVRSRARSAAEPATVDFLLLLYAQNLATISRLTVGHVHTTADQVSLQLGTSPDVLPKPLAIHSPVLPRDRDSRRHSRPHVGHPHQGHRRLAASLLQALGDLRRRRQPSRPP
jgi:hypothetical protein